MRMLRQAGDRAAMSVAVEPGDLMHLPETDSENP